VGSLSANPHLKAKKKQDKNNNQSQINSQVEEKKKMASLWERKRKESWEQTPLNVHNFSEKKGHEFCRGKKGGIQFTATSKTTI